MTSQEQSPTFCSHSLLSLLSKDSTENRTNLLASVLKGKSMTIGKDGSTQKTLFHSRNDHFR